MDVLEPLDCFARQEGDYVWSVVLIGLLAVTRMFDPVIGTRALLLSPLVLGADVTIGTLQIGNLQRAVIALAMLAMVLFTLGKYVAGGALLAFVTVSKMFPGILRLSAFLHQLPRLLSGEAFPVFRRPGGVATNLSVPGLLFKLKLRKAICGPEKIEVQLPARP